jgi:hypothetical protein
MATRAAPVKPLNIREILPVALDLFSKRDNTSYLLYRDYYNGDHRLNFATTKFTNTFAGLFREFSLNLCTTIVDTLSDRIQLEGFDVVPDPLADIQPDEKTVQDSLTHIWEENRMDRRQHEAHHETFQTGDGYVIVWPDPETQIPIFWPQRAEEIMVTYNSENPTIIDWAIKVWTTTDLFQRVTFYAPDATYRFISNEKVRLGQVKKEYTDFKAYTAEGDTQPWPIPNPYFQVPVFAFRNNSGKETEGRSELRDVIPIQDAINKTVMDMIVGQEFFSLPQRYATGIEQVLDDKGDPKSPFEIAVGRLWVTAAKDVNFGQFPPADVSMLLKNAEGLISKLPFITRIPLHYLIPVSGDRWPSGEALKTAEAPFSAKIADRQTGFGNSWEDAFSFGLLTMGLESVKLKSRWLDANPRGDAEKFDRFILLVQAGIDEVLAATLVEFPKDVIAAITVERDRKLQMAQDIANAQVQAAQANQAAAQNNQNNQNNPPGAKSATTPAAQQKPPATSNQPPARAAAG